MGVQGGTRGEFVIKAAIPPPHWGLWSALRPSASPPHLSTSSSLSHPAWDPCLLTVLPLQPSDSHLSQSSLALNSALLKRIPHLHVWVPWSYIFICGSILICITFVSLHKKYHRQMHGSNSNSRDRYPQFQEPLLPSSSHVPRLRELLSQIAPSFMAGSNPSSCSSPQHLASGYELSPSSLTCLNCPSYFRNLLTHIQLIQQIK